MVNHVKNGKILIICNKPNLRIRKIWKFWKKSKILKKYHNRKVIIKRLQILVKKNNRKKSNPKKILKKKSLKFHRKKILQKYFLKTT